MPLVIPEELMSVVELISESLEVALPPSRLIGKLLASAELSVVQVEPRRSMDVSPGTEFQMESMMTMQSETGVRWPTLPLRTQNRLCQRQRMRLVFARAWLFVYSAPQS